MAPLTIPAHSDQACDCCGRFHRKMRRTDGYWMGVTCEEHYTLYQRDSDVYGSMWRGYEKQHVKVARMVQGR